MTLGFGLLGFLNYGPMTGYELAKAFESSLKFFWQVQNSQLYLELKRLEKEGMITGETVIQQDRPNKRVYSITETGRAAFLDWLARLPEDGDVRLRSVFLMRVFFSGSLPPKQNAAMFRQFEQVCGKRLKQMDSVPESIEYYGEWVDPKETVYWQFTADFGRAYLQACMDWAKRCAEKLEAME